MWVASGVFLHSGTLGPSVPESPRCSQEGGGHTRCIKACLLAYKSVPAVPPIDPPFPAEPLEVVPGLQLTLQVALAQISASGLTGL